MDLPGLLCSLRHDEVREEQQLSGMVSASRRKYCNRFANTVVNPIRRNQMPSFATECIHVLGNLRFSLREVPENHTSSRMCVKFAHSLQ